jgi:hypothetical protein
MGIGINGFGAPLNYVFIEDVEVQSFGGNGVNIGNALVSHLTGVISQLNGGDGFSFFVDTGPPTSTVLNACFGNANTGRGIFLSSCQTHVLNACAFEGNTGVGIELAGCHAVTLNGVDVESNASPQVSMHGGSANTINGMNVYHSTGTSIALTAAEVNATLTGCYENTPSGATAFISTGAGTSCVVINDNHATANSFAAGTAYEILPTSAVFH